MAPRQGLQFRCVLFVLIISFWLCWVFAAVWTFLELQPAGAAPTCGARDSRCAGSSCCRARNRLQEVWCVGSAAPQHVESPLTRDHPCPLHWQAKSQPRDHQGNPSHLFLRGCQSYWIRAYPNDLLLTCKRLIGKQTVARSYVRTDL